MFCCATISMKKLQKSKKWVSLYFEVFWESNSVMIFQMLIYYRSFCVRSCTFATTVVATFELPFGGYYYPYIIIFWKQETKLPYNIIDDIFFQTIFHQSSYRNEETLNNNLSSDNTYNNQSLYIYMNVWGIWENVI